MVSTGETLEMCLCHSRPSMLALVCSSRRLGQPCFSVTDDFSDAALVLAGHGSTLNAETAAPVYQHADELRRRGLFAQVLEAFWKQEPYLAQVMRGVFAPRVFVAPLFISDGYFTEEVIPRELGETTLFIAGHGTGHNENSRKAIEWQVELIRAKNLFAGVHAVFMEEDPRVGECYQLAQTKNMVVAPFFISDGLHSFEDIPVMLGAPRAVVRERLKLGQPPWRNPTEREGKRLWYAASVGSEPLMAEVILERVRESAAAP